METQTLASDILNAPSKTSARSSIGSAVVGLAVTITNALLQILMIYWILGAFGTQFNGFIRVSMALAIVGGTSDGAMGVTTIILMTKPIMEKDWISANEIFSTAKREYRSKFWNHLAFVVLISIAYPLFIVVSPMISEGSSAVWSIQPTKVGLEAIQIWQLGFICFFYGLKEVVSSSFFGIYENIMEADKENYLRRSIILITDIVVYLSILFMLNETYQAEATSIPPAVTFLPILVYPFIRGFLIKWYVTKKYKWLKYYSDFNDYKLLTKSNKLFFSSISLNILMNFDIFIIFIILGTSGLRVSSMLSIYMIIALNIRVIMLTFITSFRDYFLLIILKEGRLSWEKYINYEMYTYVIAALNFIIMAISAQMIATGLYGSVLQSDFASISQTSSSSTVAEAYGLQFIFSNKAFSVLFAATTSIIIMIQGQFLLIQAKGTANKITTSANIVMYVYVAFSVIVLFALYRTKSVDLSENNQWIPNLIVGFYVIKLLFSIAIYSMFWFYTWKYVTYNSSAIGLVSNALVILIPLITILIFMFFFQDKIGKVEILINPDDLNNLVNIAPISVTSLVSLLSVAIALSIPLCFILPILFRPKVGLSMLLNIPYLKAVLEKQKISSKLQRFAKAGFSADNETYVSKEVMEQLYENLQESNEEVVLAFGSDLNHYQEKYRYKKNPKIYTIKNNTTNEAKK